MEHAIEHIAIAGIDGCRGGWYVVGGSLGDGIVDGVVNTSFAGVLAEYPPPAVIAIDIPIGLSAVGHRRCDLAARQLLRPLRSSSVFPAPLRAILSEHSYAEASARRRAIEGKGMSKQAFAITAKVREIDTALQSGGELAGRVFEVHPEVSFAAMNSSRPLSHPKKRSIGRAERIALLAQHFGDTVERLIMERPKKLVAADDVLDAMVAFWTGCRIARGASMSLPAVSERDEVGLPMAINY